MLQDAQFALDRLDAVESKVEYRVLWVAVVALLRGIGHALHKVDGEDPGLRSAINEAWKRWQADREQHAIFWDFIERERNNVLKQYEHGYFDGPVPILADRQVYEIGELLFTPMSEGRYEGEDARDVAADALKWWDAELAIVEATQKRTGT